jgi:ionotropic glutamate receptor NMDA 2B
MIHRIAYKTNPATTIHRYLRNVTVEGGFGKPDIAFSSDGTLKSVELKIMNLRPGISSNLVWEVVSSLKLLSL